MNHVKSIAKHMAKLLYLLPALSVSFAADYYLPPSIYPTLSTRHRTYFAQPAYKDIPITVHVAHVNALDVDVKLFYGNSIGDYTSVAMNDTLVNGVKLWHAIIPGYRVNSAAVYFYVQVDDSVFVRTSPENNPAATPYTIDVNFAYDESTPPIIELMPRTARMDSLVLCNRENILISAYVVDHSSPFIDDVQVRYQIDDIVADLADVMERRSDYLWNVIIPKEALSNSVHLQILANDPLDPGTTYWPPLDSSRFTINTSARDCRTVPPFIRLSEATRQKTVEEGGNDLPYQIPIDVEVITDMPSSTMPEKVWLYYQPPFMTDFVRAELARSNLDSVWQYTIPAAAVADPIIKFFVELVNGKDEVTDPIWKAGLRHFIFPVKTPNLPPNIRRTEKTRALDKTIWQAGRAVPIEAIITDYVGPQAIAASVFFRKRGDTSFTEEPMQAVQDSLWRAEIPQEKVTVGFLEYYIYADDGEDATTAPDRTIDPDSIYVIEIQNLNAPPVIKLTPETRALLTASQPARIALTIEAFVVDTLGAGVESVVLHYKNQRSDYDIKTMVNISDSLWHAIIPAEQVLPDTLYFWLSASDGDSSSFYPQILRPWDSPLKIVVTLKNELPLIVHTPPPSAPAGQPFLIEASVIDTTLNLEYVQMFYRNAEDSAFWQLDVEALGGDLFRASVAAEKVIDPWLQYFIRAKGDYGPADTSRTPIYMVSSYSKQEVVPNPFTPNGDGFNDEVVFHIDALQSSGGEVIIYNRRGRVVRRLYGMPRWDGRDDGGGDLPPGVYLYGVMIDGRLITSGTLTLIR